MHRWRHAANRLCNAGVEPWIVEENSLKKSILSALAGVFFLAGHLPATPLVYLGTLGGGFPFVSGSVVGSGSGNCGLCGHGDLNTTRLLDFWKVEIDGPVAQTVTLTGTRLDNNLDLAFVLYSGLLPEFPTPPLDSSLRDGKRIWQDGSPLGLTILAVGDDEIDKSPLPYGDPKITITLDPGIYTLAVSGGTGSGSPVATEPDNYFIFLESGQPELIVDTPEPSAYLMIGTGLAALAGLRRRLKS
jgi:hypothetical protein